MSTNTRDLILRIIGDATGMNKATKQAEASLENFQSKVGKVGSAIAAAFAGGAILNFAKVSVQAALEDQRAQERLAKTLENVTKANASQVAAVEKSIASMQSQFAVADDELRPALESLVRATKDTGQAQQLLKLALDISAGSGKGLQEVSVALVKAMGGQTRGLRDLGIQVKDTEGKALSFNDIVGQLSGTFAGQAAKAADSQTGRLKALAIQYDELKETVGTALLPVLAQLAAVATSLFGWFNNLDQGTQKLIAQIVIFGGIAFSAVKVFGAISSAVTAFRTAVVATEISLGPLTLALGIIGAFIGTTAIGMSKLGKESRATAAEIDGLTEALKRQAAGQAQAVREFIVNELVKLEGIKEFTKETGITVSDLADVIMGKQVPAFVRLRKSVTDITDDLPGMIKQSTVVGKVLDLNGKVTLGVIDAVDGMGEAYGLAKDRVQLTTNALEGAGTGLLKLIGRVQASKDETDDYAKKLDEFATKLYSTGDAASSLATEIENAVSDIRAQFDTGLAADKALQEFNDAVKNLKDDLKDLKQDSTEYNIVVKEGADKALQSAEAYAEMLTQTRHLNKAEESIAKNQAMINHLSDLIKTLDPNSPLRQYLTGFIDDLLKVPGTYDARIKVTVAGMPGIAAPDVPGNNFGLTPEQIAAILANVKKRAAGGPVSAGSPYIVGEDGPELFVPGTSGTIMPNGSTSGSGSVVNVTINTVAGDPLAIERMVLDALGRASRRGMTTLRP